MVILDQYSKTIKTPDVSVIIPTYNRISMLEEALSSVYDQDFDGFIEIVVVDDNSEDGTSETISQKYPDITLISLDKNIGHPAARNKALVKAKAKYIAFLDSDDLWEPNYLTTQISALEGRENYFAVSAILIMKTANQEKHISYQKPQIGRFVSSVHQLLVSSSFMATSSVVFPRYVFEDIGLYDETFRVGADREFYLRCLLNNYKLIWNEQPLAIWRQHNQGQLTNRSVSKIKLRRKTRITYLQKHSSAIEKQLKSVLVHRLYAEIYLTSAREFFEGKYYLSWVLSYVELAKYASLNHVIINMIRDVLRPTKKFLPFNISIRLKQIFLSNTFST